MIAFPLEGLTGGYLERGGGGYRGTGGYRERVGIGYPRAAPELTQTGKEERREGKENCGISDCSHEEGSVIA
jgi:hypothetical protein